MNYVFQHRLLLSGNQKQKYILRRLYIDILLTAVIADGKIDTNISTLWLVYREITLAQRNKCGQQFLITALGLLWSNISW